jgi:hypothetical protein
MKPFLPKTGDVMSVIAIWGTRKTTSAEKTPSPLWHERMDQIETDIVLFSLSQMRDQDTEARPKLRYPIRNWTLMALTGPAVNQESAMSGQMRVQGKRCHTTQQRGCIWRT